MEDEKIIMNILVVVFEKIVVKMLVMKLSKIFLEIFRIVMFGIMCLDKWLKILGVLFLWVNLKSIWFEE